MRKHRHATFGREPEHPDHFEPSRTRRVLDPHTDAKSARVELRAKALLHAFNLRGTRSVIRSATRRWNEDWIVNRRIKRVGARRGMARGRAGVDKRVPLLPL